MPHQTDKDPRILVTELALKKLKSAIFTKTSVRPGLSRDETNAFLSTMDSKLMAMKYCYMEPAELASNEMTQELVNAAKEIYLAYKDSLPGMPDMPKSTLLWCFNVFSGLARRLKNDGDSLSRGVDLVAVQIRNISKNGNLFTTHCIAGPRGFTIVTNIDGLKAGDTLAAALLPPAVVGGVVSEAMFLGGESIDAEPGTFLEHSKFNTKEADGILYNEVSKK